MSDKRCSNCAYLVASKDETPPSCQVANPGQRTEIADPFDEDSACPRWEGATLKSAIQKKRSSREEPIIYDIIR